MEKPVVLIKTALGQIDYSNRQMLMELKQMTDISHENIAQFVGVCVHLRDADTVISNYSKGKLEDVLHNDDIHLDYLFKLSFMADIAAGMSYIHRSEIRTHGRLKAANCWIDSRWVVKLSGFGLWKLRKIDRLQGNVVTRDSMWIAPELLREGRATDIRGTPKGDVYSFAITIFEINARAHPYDTSFEDIESIVQKIKDGSEGKAFRPCIDVNFQEPITNLMKACWDENPERRPHFLDISKKLIAANGGKAIRIVDTMINMLEKHATHMEEIVGMRTQELEDEKLKSDTLLYQMLPPIVAERLKRAEVVQPEQFQESTIYFSDIVDFTQMSSQSTPLQIVDLLNQLYSMFDDVIRNYVVYKVETIGDAYMVAGGLPVRSHLEHAGEVATMALDILAHVDNFTIPHMPDNRLLVRIGLHSGPCVAGVVGIIMPRYCLFGDTINTASRMESTGQALRIHMSDGCRQLLVKLGGYISVSRGEIQIKGKGEVKTHWLTGKEGFEKMSVIAQNFLEHGTQN